MEAGDGQTEEDSVWGGGDSDSDVLHCGALSVGLNLYKVSQKKQNYCEFVFMLLDDFKSSQQQTTWRFFLFILLERGNIL